MIYWVDYKLLFFFLFSFITVDFWVVVVLIFLVVVAQVFALVVFVVGEVVGF